MSAGILQIDEGQLARAEIKASVLRVAAWLLDS